MKISKLFHWLYFIVMMLPIFVIPCFGIALRSDNNYQPISLSTDSDLLVDFNQLNSFNALDNTFTYSVTDYELNLNGSVSTVSYVPIASYGRIKGHKYLLQTSFTNLDGLRFYASQSSNAILANSNYRIWTETLDNDISYIRLYVYGSYLNNNINISSYVNLYDLTQMFGVGNEPSAELFFTYFHDSYYPYTLSNNVLVTNGVINYVDTDVGSQMVYTMYQGVNKYFNYDNAFNFGDLYTWLNTNFFNGAAPLGFFIFWHLLIYWLLTSLLWLLFDVLIYVPMLIHRWLDKASLS